MIPELPVILFLACLVAATVWLLRRDHRVHRNHRPTLDVQGPDDREDETWTAP